MLLFFDLSSGEILLILFVAFIVLGPKRIPEVARTVGKAMNEMKRASAGFKNEINKEVQRLDRETRLGDYLSEKNLTNIDQYQKPVAETKEFISETTSSKKNKETDEIVQ
jgi:sec-independent protein translocase protein TatB